MYSCTQLLSTCCPYGAGIIAMNDESIAICYPESLMLAKLNIRGSPHEAVIIAMYDESIAMVILMH